MLMVTIDDADGDDASIAALRAAQVRGAWAADPVAGWENMTRWAATDRAATARCAADLSASARSLWVAADADGWEAASVWLEAGLAVLWAGWLVATGWARRKLKVSRRRPASAYGSVPMAGDSDRPLRIGLRLLVRCSWRGAPGPGPAPGGRD